MLRYKNALGIKVRVLFPSITEPMVFEPPGSVRSLEIGLNGKQLVFRSPKRGLDEGLILIKDASFWNQTDEKFKNLVKLHRN